jgi:hypothetical protein
MTKKTAVLCALLLSFAAIAMAAGPRPAARPAATPVPTSAAAFFQSLASLNANAPAAPVAKTPGDGLDALLGQPKPTPTTCRTCFDESVDCQTECTCGGTKLCINGCAFCQCDLCW